MKDILEEASKIIGNVEEDIEITEMLEEREKRDDGKRYTLEEVWAERNKNNTLGE